MTCRLTTLWWDVGLYFRISIYELAAEMLRIRCAGTLAADIVLGQLDDFHALAGLGNRTAELAFLGDRYQEFSIFGGKHVISLRVQFFRQPTGGRLVIARDRTVVPTSEFDQNHALGPD